MSTDFAPFMPEVALRLLGPANARLSSKTEQRYGTSGSLSVDVAAGRWFDHEAKVGGGVLDLIARQTGSNANGGAIAWLRDEGFPIEDDGERRQEPQRAAKPPRKIVAEYDYVDELGNFLFQVVRFEPKDFRQRRKAKMSDPPDKVNDGWVWSVKGIRQVPYRLPEVLEAIALERQVIVVEGEKDADNLWKIGIPATTAAMGAGKWPDEIAAFFSGADVVVIADNDPQARGSNGELRFHSDGRPVYTGQDHAEDAARALLPIASRVRVLQIGGPPAPPNAGPNLAAKSDISDWLADGHTGDELALFIDRLARAPVDVKQRLHFGAVWFKDAFTLLADPEWLVDDFLTRGDMSLVYGASQSGKSFLATHMAMGVARGEAVFERKVHQGGVVYIAAEGRKGFKKRLRAYALRHGIDKATDLPFVLVPSSVDLFARGENVDIDKLLLDLGIIEAEMQRRGLTVELIVVDTWAAVSPGANENASEDVSRVVKNVQRFRERCPGAHVMIVHHKNAGGERPRGHTSLYAGIDNAIEVSVDPATKVRTAVIEKMKDGEDGIEIGFRLETVEIGQRADGRLATSCVVVPSDLSQIQPATGKGPWLSDQQKIALEALREALMSHGEPAPSALQLPMGVTVVRSSHWKREFLRRGFDEDPNTNTFKSAYKRVLQSLQAKHVVGLNSPYIWIAREPSR